MDIKLLQINQGDLLLVTAKDGFQADIIRKLLEPIVKKYNADLMVISSPIDFTVLKGKTNAPYQT